MVKSIDANQEEALETRLQQLDRRSQWPQVAGRRPSSLAASCLIVDGRRTTHKRRSFRQIDGPEADIGSGIR
jgi:hypothetical protein